MKKHYWALLGVLGIASSMLPAQESPQPPPKSEKNQREKQSAAKSKAVKIDKSKAETKGAANAKTIKIDKAKSEKNAAQKNAAQKAGKTQK